MKNWYNKGLLSMLVVCSPMAFAQVNCDVFAAPKTTVAKAHSKKTVSVPKRGGKKSVSTQTVAPQLLYHHGEVAVVSKSGVQQVLPSESTVAFSLSSGDVISAGAQSFSVIQFQDGSQVTIPSHSTVRLKSVLTRPIAIELLEGRIDNSVTPMLDPSGEQAQKNFSFLVGTPSLNLGVRGTQFQVAHDDKVSFVSVEEGEVVIQRLSGGCERAIDLFRRDGAFVSQAGVKKTQLLESPDISKVPSVFRGGSVLIQTSQVVGAERYHVQAAHDANFTYLFEENFSEQPDLKLSTLDNGYYYIRVTAIDQDGVAGLSASKRILFQHAQ